MAILVPSSVWPITQARNLHQRAQMQYNWKFYVPNESPGQFDINMGILAQEVSFPGFNCEQETYEIGQLEQYRLGASKRGGPVSATFIEVQGGYVDQFFRGWFEEVDANDGITGFYVRNPVSFYTRNAEVHLITREGEIGSVFNLLGLMPVNMSPYSSLNYAGTGPVLLTVEMVCNEVVRTV